MVSLLKMTGRAFTKKELLSFLKTNKSSPHLTKFNNVNQFITDLIDTNVLKPINYLDLNKRDKKLYFFPNTNNYSLIGAIQKEGYFSHYSAMVLNGITTLESDVFYLNCEHSKKSKSVDLLQENIDKAFSKPSRISKRYYELNKKKIIHLNGGYTNKLGVITSDAEDGFYSYTDIERTLIDIVVKPEYAGGVFEVLNIFCVLKGKVDLVKLRKYLDELNYNYPYEQAIGYYLNKAKYEMNDQNLFYTKNRYNYRFYLARSMNGYSLDNKWNLFIPNKMKEFKL